MIEVRSWISLYESIYPWMWKYSFVRRILDAFLILFLENCGFSTWGGGLSMDGLNIILGAYIIHSVSREREKGFRTEERMNRTSSRAEGKVSTSSRMGQHKHQKFLNSTSIRLLARYLAQSG